MTLRCTEGDCRYSESTRLPQVDKAVVYLDQNAFSVLFKAQSAGRLPKGHEDFCRELLRLSQRALLLQQVVFPNSDIHHDETTVFREAEALRSAYQTMGGDVRLKDVHNVELMQAVEFASSFVAGRQPSLSFHVDEVLKSQRNRWLNDMHITVNSDYSQFATAIRASRDRAHEAMTNLVAAWSDEKPSFETILARETAAYGTSKVQAFFRALHDYALASEAGDMDGVINSSMSHIMHEHRVLSEVFGRAGIAEDDRTARVVDFWRSDHAVQQPMQVISAHLFAAVARRVTLGQRSFSRGLMNDVRAISAYAPYVDAMFVDKEFELILRQTPQLRRLPIKARIFSFGTTSQFIEYLEGLCEGASPEVSSYASRIYGVR